VDSPLNMKLMTNSNYFLDTKMIIFKCLLMECFFKLYFHFKWTNENNVNNPNNHFYFRWSNLKKPILINLGIKKESLKN